MGCLKLKYYSELTFAKSCKSVRRDYMFGFNGQEKDNEIKGTGNSLDFGARVYDSRLGRFLSLDPVQQNFPFQSPYLFASNNPVYLIDMEGKFGKEFHKKITEQACANLGIATNGEICKRLVRQNVNQDAIWNINNLRKSVHLDNLQGQKLLDAFDRVQANNSNNDLNGENLHTLQDFYAHSNSVEMYVEFNNIDISKLDPSSIPLMENTSPEFKEFLATAKDANGDAKFKTGNWDYGPDNVKGAIAPNQLGNGDPNHHEVIAKDSPDHGKGAEKTGNGDKKYYDYSADLATRASEKVIESKVQIIK
jgi:RHS repeat-associated protein